MAAVAISVVFLATWFAWSVITYGVETTFASNTAVMAPQRVEGGNLQRIALNVIDTLVPHPLRGHSLSTIEQKNEFGYLRDYAFLIYQTNAIFAMGVVGGLVVVGLLVKGLVSRSHSALRGQRLFWILLVVCCTVLGIAVVGERQRFGVAHICLLPIVLMGLAFLAGYYRRLPKILRWMVIGGCVLDFAVGIFLHFRLQSMAFRTWSQDGRNYAVVLGEGELLCDCALGNWALKEKFECIFWADHLVDYSALIQLVIIALFLVIVGVMVREAMCPGIVAARSQAGTSSTRLPARFAITVVSVSVNTYGLPL